jgi:ATP/maltotriose-dependent transcriptional regulator MalT/DNA-binding SARP family transcriptional activator
MGEVLFPDVKIQRPQLGKVLLRQRLFKRLDRAREKPLIWVSGPAGSGKTTLVNSYVDHHGLDCVWYKLDRSDSDIGKIFHYLRMVGKGRGEKDHRFLPAFAPEHASNLSSFTGNFFDGFCSLFEEGPFLVLDNYQDVQDRKVLARFLMDAADRMPKGGSLVITSRTEPPPVFSGLRALDRMEILGWKDLKLDGQEHLRFFGILGIEGLSEDSLANLIGSADGWITGLLILTKYIRNQEVLPKGPFGPVTEPLFDFFATQILDTQPVEIRNFLLLTSLMPFTSPEMAGKLTGISRPDRILDYLRKENLFIDRFGHDPFYYHFHQLFREFLVKKVELKFTPAEIKKLKRSAAGILRASGYAESSLDLLRDSKDWAALTDIIGERAPTWLREGRYETLANWVGSIPVEVLEQNPTVLYWKGRKDLPFDPVGSRECHRRAFGLYLKEGNSEGCYRAWCGEVATYVLYQDNLDGLRALLDRFEELCQTFPPPDDIMAQARVAASVFSALVYVGLDHPDLETWGERAVELSRRAGAVNLQAWALFTKGLLSRFRGDLAGMSLVSDSLLRMAKERDVSFYNRIAINVFRAMDCFFRNDVDGCLEATEEGIRIAQQSGVNALNPVIYGLRVSIMLANGNKEGAGPTLEYMAKHLDGALPFGRNYVHRSFAWYYLCAGNLHLALRHAEEGLNLARMIGLPENLAVNFLSIAHISLEKGDLDRAEEYLNESLSHGERIGSPLIRLQCFLLRARVAYHRGNLEIGDDHLAKAFSIGKAHAYVSWYFFQPGVMSGLCARALGAGIEVDYVRDLIRKRGLSPEGKQAGLEAWPWPVKIYTMGRFDLIRDGTAVQFSGKAKKVPLDMLKAVIAFGGKKVRKDIIIDALWPDADGDAGQQSFATTLHRLRKFLGLKDVLQVSHGQLTLNPLLCWVDVWALEDVMEQVELLAGLRSSSTIEQIDRSSCEDYMNLYRGHFLASDDHKAWTAPVRERLRSRYLRTVTKLGKMSEESGDWEKASELYRKVLEVDDLAEDVYRRLMLCYQKMGRRAEAVAVCHRCMDRLGEALDLEISPETQKLCDEIRGNG